MGRVGSLLRMGGRILLSAALIWIGVRFVLPLLAPFRAAFVLASAMERAVRALLRRSLPRGLAAALLTLALLALLCALPVLLLGQVLPALSALIRAAPRLVQAVEQRLDALELLLGRYAAALPESVSVYFRTAIASAETSINTLPTMLSARVLNLAAQAAQGSPGALLFVVTLFLGTYFFSASYPAVIAFVRAQLPQSLRRRAGEILFDLRANLGGWLRAQLILAGLTFAELLLLFSLLRIRAALPLAALTALIDALPVFGTGIVLVPWALVLLLLGQSGRAIALLVGWAVSAAGRNLLQAKLLGDQIGLHPLVSLLALYVGWRVWGVWGMIVFPLGFASLQQLTERGVIRLWNSP